MTQKIWIFCQNLAFEILIFFQYQKGKNRARRPKMDPKIDTFYQVDIRDLAILEVKKIVFWTFSKFFRLVWQVFKDCFRLYKAYYWVYFQL